MVWELVVRGSWFVVRGKEIVVLGGVIIILEYSVGKINQDGRIAKVIGEPT